MKKGRSFVEASGPVTVRGPQSEAGPGQYTVGLVEGGGRLTLDYNQFVLPLLKPDPRRALYLEGYLNTRFGGLDAVATAQQNGIVLVTVPNSYWADPMRFVEVVRLMPASDPGDTSREPRAPRDFKRYCRF